MRGAPAVESVYHDGFGRRREVPESTLERLRAALHAEDAGPAPLVTRPGARQRVEAAELVLEDGTRRHVDGWLPQDLPLGYHRLVGADSERRLIVSPGRCPLPEGRLWGWAVQLYGARSRESWGMGDLADLRSICEWSAELGAGMVLSSPALAVAPVGGQQPSPYYPASRRFLNPIYIRVEEVPGAAEVSAVSRLAAAGRALDDDPRIDRDQVWRLKVRALEAVWRTRPDASGLEEWRTQQGEELELFALWCVLAEQHGGDWRSWPAELRHPSVPAVRALATGRAERLDFHVWLQWLARGQLERAAAAGPMLVQDLPVGFDRGGADAWAYQDLLALDFSVGAPPDEFNAAGQSWGLPPFVPGRLAAAGYEPFARSLRAVLAPGGGVRIDHVMGLFRQFWVPEGAPPAEGAYVRYPASDLLDVLALEAHRAGALVVGEDLGTVEPGVRTEMTERGMLGYRVLWFEPEHPESWPELSLASVTTHDLPTVAGMWTGADLEEQAALGLDSNVDGARRIRAAVAERAGLGEGAPADRVVVEVHRLLGSAPSRIVCATLEDATRTERRPNLPGADAVRANWSLALPWPIEDVMADPVVREVAEVLGDLVGTHSAAAEPSGTYGAATEPSGTHGAATEPSGGHA